MKISSPKASDLSPDCASDPEEKEVSDEDDDDRNHKHRRRETRSQSLERDSVDQVFTRPHRKHNKTTENGHIFRESESQGNETWKNYNVDKDLAPKFDRRLQGFPLVSRAPYDQNQRARTNQTFIGDPGHGRGRGRDGGSWNHRDSRFSAAGIASQMVQPGAVPPNIFPGRGLPSVSNSQNPSWGAFALMPGIPNGGLDALHSVGLPGTLRPQLTPSLNMGIPRQRCRDFEERGFCLRGDMCPMEHGMNRIVVDDVQSLSQFNLPVSLTSTQLLATPAGPPLPPVVGPATSLINSNVHVKSSRLGMMDDGMDLNGAFVGSASANGADFYDPDQPLWTNNGLEPSATLSALHSPKKDESGALLNDDLPDHHQMRTHDGAGNERQARATGARSTSLSVWGRISSRNKVEAKDKVSTSSDILESETKAESEALPSAQVASHHGKQIAAGGVSKPLDSSLKSRNARNIRKPSQKAQRTLFVNGIPQNSNKRDALFSHFKKFGEIIDIYIPSNSERAFVQFSKREEAEAALESPDAVMGNRFIKLWWANRDSILDDGVISGSSTAVTAVTPRNMGGTAIPGQPSVTNRGKDDLQPAVQKINVIPNIEVTASESPKPVSTNGSKLPNPLHKKLETLEQLKEELRKKQEMLAQKRNDFRRQLDKLAKQATGAKGEAPAEPVAKRPKVGIAVDPGKAGMPKFDSSTAVTAATSQQALLTVEKSKSGDNLVSCSPKVSPATVPISTSSQQLIHPFVPGGDPFLANKYKLDNRPAAFRVFPPLPSGFADVAVLKEHFSQYGDLSSVELDGEGHDQGDGSETPRSCSALVSFTSRQSAERAFVNGKSWQGHNLQLAWLASRNHSNDLAGLERLERSASLKVVPTNGAEGDVSERSGLKDVKLPEVSQMGPTAEAQADTPKGETS